MDFTLSPEQAALAEAVTRFTADQYRFEDRKAVIAGPDGFSHGHWKAFAELGWMGAGLPEEDGGFGGSAIENAIIMEAFGRALVVEPFLAHAVLSLQTLHALPRSQQRAALIEAAVAGDELIVLAHGEPEAWGATSYVETRAVPLDDGGFLLTGHKSRVLGASGADRLLVSARTGGAAVDRGTVGLFLVDPGAPGLRRQDYRLVDNSRVADLWLENVRGELFPEAHDALPAIEAGTDHAIVCACAEALGAMDTALWQTRDYLKSRKQFGTTLNHFQALQHRMADMLVEVELARSMLYQGLAALDAPSAERRRRVSAAKVAISRAGLFVGGNAIQLHGGIGMTEELAIGHYYKRLWVLASLFGDATHHLAAVVAATPIAPLPPDV